MSDSHEPTPPADEPDLWKPTICDSRRRPTEADVDRAAGISPPPPALPPEVEAALDYFDEGRAGCRCPDLCPWARNHARIDSIRTHIATLTRERDEARLEISKLRGWLDGAEQHLGTIERRARATARADALERLRRAAHASDGAHTVDELVDAELARLEAQPAAGEVQPR